MVEVDLDLGNLSPVNVQVIAKLRELHADDVKVVFFTNQKGVQVFFYILLYSHI